MTDPATQSADGDPAGYGDPTVDSASKNEAIVSLLEEAGPLSVHAITQRMNERGYRITSTGQTLTRLKTLARRNPPRVEKIDGEKGSLWQAIG